ncbi:minor capsid protein, partial [Lacticaseibacillus rhamnosus]|nr:minor capsid protein [Lacticaseibacillus rhamnosus]
MDTKQLDLDDRLADFFDMETGGSIMLGHMPENGQVSLLQDPGSAPTGAPYFNGNQPMSMQYEILCSTQDYLTARQLLSPI